MSRNIIKEEDLPKYGIMEGSKIEMYSGKTKDKISEVILNKYVNRATTFDDLIKKSHLETHGMRLAYIKSDLEFALTTVDDNPQSPTIFCKLIPEQTAVVESYLGHYIFTKEGDTLSAISLTKD